LRFAEELATAPFADPRPAPETTVPFGERLLLLNLMELAPADEIFGEILGTLTAVPLSDPVATSNAAGSRARGVTALFLLELLRWLLLEIPSAVKGTQ
jgi:hypothetical protein